VSLFVPRFQAATSMRIGQVADLVPFERLLKEADVRSVDSNILRALQGFTDSIEAHGLLSSVRSIRRLV
jgi:hypothetical protein